MGFRTKKTLYFDYTYIRYGIMERMYTFSSVQGHVLGETGVFFVVESKKKQPLFVETLRIVFGVIFGVPRVQGASCTGPL